ncbi:unnamed protein product [Alopecurus aequalis]
MASYGRTLRPPATAPEVDFVGATRPWSGVIGGVSSTEGGDMLQRSAMAMDVPLLWNDEERMKRELVAWAKAVASMAIRESMRC